MTDTKECRVETTREQAEAGGEKKNRKLPRVNNKKRHKGPERYSETKRNTFTFPNMRYKCRHINEAHTHVLKIMEWGK